jgi:hypothetical protein
MSVDARRRHLGVAHRVLDVLVPAVQRLLKRSIDPASVVRLTSRSVQTGERHPLLG